MGDKNVKKTSGSIAATMGIAIVSLIIYAVKSPMVQSAMTNWTAEKFPSQSPRPAGSFPPASSQIPVPPPPPKVAPAGSLYLTRKITVATDAGPKTFPAGTSFKSNPVKA